MRGFRWAERAANGSSIEKRQAGGRSESSVVPAGRGRLGSPATAPHLLVSSERPADERSLSVPEFPGDTLSLPQKEPLAFVSQARLLSLRTACQGPERTFVPLHRW